MTPNRPPPPIVGLPCDHRVIGQLSFHAAGEKYIDAVRDVSGALPMLLPVTRAPLDMDDILSTVHGIFLPGSPSNVSAALYGGAPPRADSLADPQRDMTVQPLICAAVERGIPLLGVCRGLQEMNVAFGGTLHQFLHEVPGRLDHRADHSAPLADQYAHAHIVDIAAGGTLASILGDRCSISVNSLHAQGIDRLADQLAVEATAPDGTVEAVSVSDAPGFTLGVQWHPEWRATENPAYEAIFSAFGEAIRERAGTHKIARTGKGTS